MYNFKLCNCVSYLGPISAVSLIGWHEAHALCGVGHIDVVWRESTELGALRVVVPLLIQGASIGGVPAGHAIGCSEAVIFARAWQCALLPVSVRAETLCAGAK